MLFPSAASQPAAANVISIRDLQAHCAVCSMRELCLPLGLGMDAMRELEALVVGHQRFKKAEPIFQTGDRFTALHAIRSGSCKTTVSDQSGREQVIGYHLMGDIVGFDGIGSGQHKCQAVTLEDTEVCAVPFARLEELASRLPPLQRNLHRLLSRELVRDENLLLMVGSMSAEERIAAFLLNLSQRYRLRGYSSKEFVLRLTRRDIGSYLGMKLETVSRLLSRFQAEKLIKIDRSVIRLLDMQGLKALLGERELRR
jgi:CRP/FNR family transcriptional regulator, anaerobic regulatory protein